MEKIKCSCGVKKSQFLYCNSCYSPLGHIPPKVSLPVKVDIYRHPQENECKTTTIGCKIIAPDDTNIYVDRIDENFSFKEDVSRLVLLFPSKDAVPLSSMDKNSFDKLIVIDGTWKQAKGMVSRLPKIRHVTIGPRETMFWRFQSFSKSYLSTIEGIFD
jgi:DTW domain-containing protein YfiP